MRYLRGRVEILIQPHFTAGQDFIICASKLPLDGDGSLLRAVHREFQTLPAALAQHLFRNLLDEPAAMDKAIAGCQAFQLAEDVARDEHRHPVFLAQLLNQRAKMRNAHRIEPVDRLVEQQQRGMIHQREGEPQPLLHAKRKILELFFARIAQLHLPQRIVNAALTRDPALAAVIFKIFPRREERKEARRFHNRT